MRIQSLSIQDFRGFHRFEMKDLGRINLLVGTNNCGKTTVLEAINLLMAKGDTSAIWSMLLQRGEAVGADRPATNPGSKPIQIWRLFRGHDIRIGACFSITSDTDSGVLRTIASVEEYDPADGRSLGVEFPPADPSEEVHSPLLVQVIWSDSQPNGAKLFIPIRGRDRTSSMAIRRNAQPGPTTSHCVFSRLPRRPSGP